MKFNNLHKLSTLQAKFEKLEEFSRLQWKVYKNFQPKQPILVINAAYTKDNALWLLTVAPKVY